KHFRRRIWALGVGVRTARITAEPGMTRAVHQPLLGEDMALGVCSIVRERGCAAHPALATAQQPNAARDQSIQNIPGRPGRAIAPASSCRTSSSERRAESVCCAALPGTRGEYEVPG